MKSLSVSFTLGKQSSPNNINIKHNQRNFAAKNIKPLKSHDNIDYFIYGHRHIELDLMLSRKVRMMIIGDWISQFTYVVFDGEHLFLEEYVEGESKM